MNNSNMSIGWLPNSEQNDNIMAWALGDFVDQHNCYTTLPFAKMYNISPETISELADQDDLGFLSDAWFITQQKLKLRQNSVPGFCEMVGINAHGKVFSLDLVLFNEYGEHQLKHTIYF